ncbi:DUF2304 family protein [Nocardioides dilutus]
MIIKVVLIAALAAAAFVLMRGRRTALSMLVRRGLALSAIVVGIVAVLVPDALTEVAQAVGVGRGADLLLYLLCITFLFVSIGLYMRLTEMHDRYVELARRLALHEANADAHQPAVTERRLS